MRSLCLTQARIFEIFVSGSDFVLPHPRRFYLQGRMTSNSDLWQRTNQMPDDAKILKRRWRWIGRILRKPLTSITRQVLSRNPWSKRKCGRPRNSRCWKLEADLRTLGAELESAREERPGQRPLENSCRWPMPLEGVTQARRASIFKASSVKVKTKVVAFGN